MTHHSRPTSGVILGPGQPPEVACGEPDPEEWCGDIARVDCAECRLEQSTDRDFDLLDRLA